MVFTGEHCRRTRGLIQANVYITNQIPIQPSTGIINIPGSSQLQINGTKVIGTRDAAITDVNTVNLILAALRTHGLIAP